MEGTALINGQNHSHKQIVFNVGGVPLTSLSDLTITEAKNREFSYGAQGLPVGYGDGKDEPVEVSFTLSKKDSDNLRFASPGRKQNNLPPFDIPMTLTNPSAPRFTIIKNVLIQSVEMTSDEDTTDIKESYTCIASHLKSEF